MKTQPHNHRTAFSVTNCICYDQRVHKMARTVQEFGTDITIIGRKRGSCCEKDTVPWKTRRFRMVFKKGFLFYKFYNIRLFFYLLYHRFDLLVANDLDTLLPNFLVSRLKRIPLVYDSHEYFTGVPELNGRPFVKWVWTKIENALFPRLKHVITVSDSIADIYEKKYKVRPVVVRNLSPSSDDIVTASRAESGIPEGHFLVILQGGGIHMDKGGEEAIDSLLLADNVSLVIAGSGDILSELKEKVTKLGLTERVRFTGMMPWKELLRITKSSDAGLSLEKDTNLNYRYSLPNKLFDYISAGIPVITGNLPEIKQIVEAYDFGVIIPSVTPEEISNAILKLRGDNELYNKLKRNSISASRKLNWDTESRKVYKLYSEIFKK